MPPSKEPSLAERARAWSQHEHARSVLAKVLEVCRAESIRALPVKGVLTAHRLYGDPSERPIQDIDLRVTPRDLARLTRITPFPIVEQSRAYRSLGLQVDGMLVEFEAHVGPRGLSNLQVETLLRRAEPHIAPFGFEHLEPELHDHALLLVVNAFKDKLIEAMPWAVRDLELVAGLPRFDPVRLATLARQSGLATLAWIVADWLADVRAQPAWAEVRDHLVDPPRSHYRSVMQRITRGQVVPRLALRILVRAASDRASRQAASLGFTLAREIEQRLRRAPNP